MATAQMDTVIRHLRRTVLRQDRAGWTDGQLLASFIDHEDEAAFESLVRRHGPMVFGVCRRVARNHHDAEDAFQATFLVLVRKASSVKPRKQVANWLHGVALRAAMKTKATAARRRGREQQVTELPEPEAARQDQWSDLHPLLDQELNGLPENYRLPILLCDLEGKTIKEATRELGWPQGTLAGRLARGRKLLAKRLTNRGVVLSAASLGAVVLEHSAAAAVPTSLMSSTVKAAAMIAAGEATVAGVVPAKVAILTEGVLKAMLLMKLKTVLSIVLMLGVVCIGSGLLMHRTAAGQQTESGRGEKPTAGQLDPLRGDARTVTTAEAKHDAAKTDLDQLQGIWSVVSMERGGQPAKLEKAAFMVDGKRACWQTKDAEIEGGLYLEPTSKPKTYDLAMTTRTQEGIYSLEGDILRLCYDLGTNPKRPGSFITEKGSQRVLVVLKRIHGREAFPFLLPDGTRAFPKVIEAAKTPPPRIAPQPKATPNAGQGYKTATDSSQAAPPPEAAGPPEYVITSRLLEAGADQPREILRLPKMTLYDGQLGPLRIPDNPQNLLAKVVDDEKIKIGTFLDVRAKRLAGNKVRLVVSFQRNEAEKYDEGEIRVLGNSVQAIQDVDLRKPVKMVFQKDAGGRARRWIEITVDGPAEVPVPPAPYATEKTPSRVGMIIIVGNTKTATSVLLKRIPLSPGDILDYQALRAAKKNLAAFNPTITVVESSNNSNFKDVLVTVKEK